MHMYILVPYFIYVYALDDIGELLAWSFAVRWKLEVVKQQY